MWRGYLLKHCNHSTGQTQVGGKEVCVKGARSSRDACCGVGPQEKPSLSLLLNGDMGGRTDPLLFFFFLGFECVELF